MNEIRIRYAEQFAGVGGFRQGIEQAERVYNGRGTSSWQARFDCVYANEFDKHASAVYRHIWRGNGELKEGDVREQNTDQVPDIDFLTAGFPCFGKGTLILTRAGYNPIEDVSIGDEVLTHLGRWRKVTARHTTDGRSTRIVSGQGFIPVVTTDEHPFYVRGVHREWANNKRSYNRIVSEPAWVPASEVAGHYIGSVLPETQDLEGDEDLWWIVGRYLADGWLVNRRDRGNGGVNKVIICCRKEEAPYLKKRVGRKFSFSVVEERTSTKLHISNKEFAEFLEPAGRGAPNKQFPTEWLGLPKRKAESLLDGYMSGDGCVDGHNRCQSATTVSPKLALGIVMLSHKVYGVRSSVTRVSVSGTKTIEGRTVNQRPWYRVQIPLRNRSGLVDERYSWGLARKSVGTGRLEAVYNISVEEDESYTANGCIVHNCQSFSVAGRRLGMADTRGTLFFEVARFLADKRPGHFLLENVKGLLSHDDGKTFQTILGVLADLGYRTEWEVLNSTCWVPQNRERVFIVGHSRKECGCQVFPLREDDGVPEEDGGEMLPCLTSSDWKGSRKQRVGLIVLGNTNPSGRGMSGNIYDSAGIAPALCSETTPSHDGTMSGRPPIIATPVLTPDRVAVRQEGRRFKEPGEDMFTLTGQDVHGVLVAETAFTKSNRTSSRIKVSDTVNNLDSGHSCAIGVPVQGTGEEYPAMSASQHKEPFVVLTAGHKHQDLRLHETEGEVPILKERMGTGGNNVPIVPVVHKTGPTTVTVRDNETGCLVRGSQGSPMDKVPSVAMPDSCISLDCDGYLRLTGARPRDENGKPQLLPIGRRRFRRLTPTECERLQGWNDLHTALGLYRVSDLPKKLRNGDEFVLQPVSDTQRYRMTGNGVTADVVREVVLKMLKVGCFG